LELISKDKLILGVPFYSRVWNQIGSGKVNSKSVGFSGQKKWLKETGAESVYDESTGQNYAEAIVDGISQKIWLEDAESLSMRIKLAKKYDLPGIAGWSLLFTTDEVWEQMREEYPSKGGL
jgi:spore germination protein YaaH